MNGLINYQIWRFLQDVLKIGHFFDVSLYFTCSWNIFKENFTPLVSAGSPEESSVSVCFSFPKIFLYFHFFLEWSQCSVLIFSMEKFKFCAFSREVVVGFQRFIHEVVARGLWNKLISETYSSALGLLIPGRNCKPKWESAVSRLFFCSF